MGQMEAHCLTNNMLVPSPLPYAQKISEIRGYDFAPRRGTANSTESKYYAVSPLNRG
jgi:hypothetical protein